MPMPKEKTGRKHTTITIPATLFHLLEERMAHTGFGSVSSYATYVLRETVLKMMQEDIKSNRNKKEVQKKLRKLGYI